LASDETVLSMMKEIVSSQMFTYLASYNTSYTLEATQVREIGL